MSKTWEHNQGSSHVDEKAEDQLKDIPKFHESEETERAVHDAYLHHEVAPAQLNPEIWDGEPQPGRAQTEKKKDAA